jgi:ADP-heptose:LPS heptosyltransferase
VPAALRRPALDIPGRWLHWALAQFAHWDFAEQGLPNRAPVVFVNAWSKSPDRTWPLDRVVALVRAMRTRARWREASFVVNTVPEARADTERYLARLNDPALARVRLFSADEHFFQLPAVMALCSLVISVETAVMHLANAVQVPVIALMRRNHPEWAPIDGANSTVVMVERMEDWVTAIGVEDVLEAID